MYIHSIVICVGGISMTDSDYGNALAAAEQELETLNNQAELIERRRAQLQQTIAALKTLTDVAEQEERTLTDTIRIVVKGAKGYIAPADVLRGVQAMGATFAGKNPISSVVTILGRLAKENELLRDPEGKGYMWAGYALHRLEALRRLAPGNEVKRGEIAKAFARGRTVPDPPTGDSINPDSLLTRMLTAERMKKK
jgi:hypothetical protein